MDKTEEYDDSKNLDTKSLRKLQTPLLSPKVFELTLLFYFIKLIIYSL